MKTLYWARVAVIALAITLACTDSTVAGQYEDAQSAYRAGDHATAFGLLKPLAERGHAGAQLDLAVMYANGDGVDRNDVEAFKWFSIAAAAGKHAARGHRERLVEQMPAEAIAEARKLVRAWHQKNK